MALSDIIPAYFEQQSINPVTIESMNADELARQQVYENINRKPVTPYLDAFVPAEMENVQLTPNAELYSSLTAKQPSSIVGGMFSPEISQAAEMEYLQKRQGDMRARAMAFAQLSPMQQADYGFYRGGQQLGDALGGALGGKDPQLQLITQRQQLLSQLDQNDPESFMKVSNLALRSGDSEFAFNVADAGKKLRESLLGARKTKAEAEKAELSASQEIKLRDELSKLPPNATEAEILGVVIKYGNPDKVLASLQRSTELRNQIEAKKEIASEKIQAQKDRDLEKAQTQKDRDEAQQKFVERMKELDRQSKKELAQLAASLRTPAAPALTTIVNPENPNETITVDARIYKGGGKNAVGVIGAGKPSATQEKSALLRKQMVNDLNFAIAELTEATKDGGLIDQSTGSGAGRLLDVGAGFFGQANEGAINIGKLQPIADMALKMVPRFEGPQSNADTKSYREASGQLADPTLPTKIRKEAGKTVLRLMKERKNQFVTSELASEGVEISNKEVDFGSLK
jgi:hypothetical protein